MTRGVLGACVCTALVVSVRPVAAQASLWDAPPAGGRFEVGVGLDWIGHARVGGASATETMPDGSRFVLFSTTTDLGGAAGADARFGVRLTRTIELDANASYSAPTLSTTATADVEGASPSTATNRVSQWIVGGSATVHLTRWRIGTRAAPFVLGEAGYLRQLFENGVAARSGQMYGFGGGVKYALASWTGRRAKGLGIKADALAVVRTKGVAPDGRSHASPALGVSLFARF